MSPSRLPRTPALRYRPARRTDVDTLADLALRAYRVSSAEARKEFYTEHPRFGLRDVRVGELDGEIVASLVLFPLSTWVRGVPLSLAGIGGVAVSPEHRRRGVGEALIRAALRERRQAGDGWSMLYAFRADWYRKLGWGLVETPHVFTLAPRVLPASEEARRVRRVRLPDRPHVQALYDRVATRGHFALARRPEWWEKRLWGYAGDWVVYERRRGQIEGYLQYEAHAENGPFKLAITVNEFVAETPAAWQGLVGHLHTLRDQAEEISIAAPADGAMLSTLAEAQNLHGDADLPFAKDAGNLGYGAMLRAVDPKSALEALPVASAARGELALDVEDPVLPQNSRAWRVSAREGRLHVRLETPRMNGSRSRVPRLALGVDALAMIASGALSPLAAAGIGLVEDVRGAAEMIEPWFRGKPVFVHRWNGF